MGELVNMSGVRSRARAYAVRSSIGLLAGLLVVLVAGPASAARPLQASVTYFLVRCDLDGPGGPVQLFVDQDLELSNASVARWAPGADPAADAPVTVSNGSTVTIDDAFAVAGTMMLADPATEMPLGTASFQMQLTSTGEVTHASDRRPSHDGNHVRKLELYTERATVAGTLTFDDATYDLAPCEGDLGTQTLFMNSPAAYAAKLEPQTGALCIVDTADYHLEMLLEGGDSVGLANVAVFPAGEELPYGFGSWIVDQERRQVSGAIPLENADFVAIGDALLAVTLPITAIEHDTVVEGGTVHRRTTKTFDVVGTLTLPNGDVLEIDGCSGQYDRGWVRRSPRRT